MNAQAVTNLAQVLDNFRTWDGVSAEAHTGICQQVANVLDDPVIPFFDKIAFLAACGVDG